MKRLLFIYILSFEIALGNFEQTAEIRDLCKQAQSLESKISKLFLDLLSINEKEKMSVPVIRNIYEMLSRCFTVLFDLGRFSDLLALTQKGNKNDFVRCSIIIKNFSQYFQSVNSKLNQSGDEIYKLKKNKDELSKDYESTVNDYNQLCKKIKDNLDNLSKTRTENVIQEDVVRHISTKCDSIDELDAELEAENTVGVLKNNKISTELQLVNPVQGKIVAEFGDRGDNDEMIYYLGFETRHGAIVTSPAKGLVVFSGSFLNYKNMVIISNGEYRIFIYGMQTVFASTGDTLDIGDYLGKMDTDSKELPTLKMELKRSGEPLDPRHWLWQSLENKENK